MFPLDFKLEPMFVVDCCLLAEYLAPVDLTASKLPFRNSVRVLISFWDARLMFPASAVEPIKLMEFPVLMFRLFVAVICLCW